MKQFAIAASYSH